jgi:hypothetical protein
VEAGWYIKCEKCNAPLEIESPMCENCHEIYYDDFWTKFLDEWDPELDLIDFDEMEEVEVDYTKMYKDSHNLCCNMPPEQCECLRKATWNDLYDVGLDYVEQYQGDMDSPCWQCNRVCEASCPPLRVWAREAILGARDIGKISPCSEFVSWDSVSVGPIQDYEY